jgi:hypothetical protein
MEAAARDRGHPERENCAKDLDAALGGSRPWLITRVC